MEQLIELLQQIQELAGVGIDALMQASEEAGVVEGGGDPEMDEGLPPEEEEFVEEEEDAIVTAP